MKNRELRSPKDRVGTYPNTALPPPGEASPTIDDLLRRALVHRDEAALRAAVYRLQPDMIDIAAHYVRSRADAEDVVQETWLAALDGVSRFEGRASLKTWLLRILTYRAISAARRADRAIPVSQLRPRRSSTPLRPAGDPLFAWSPAGPDERLRARELQVGIDRGLAALPPQQSQVVRMRDLDGMSPREVSDRLRLSAANQRVLLHRGRRRLREHLSPEWAPLSGRKARARRGPDGGPSRTPFQAPERANVA